MGMPGLFFNRRAAQRKVSPSFGRLAGADGAAAPFSALF